MINCYLKELKKFNPIFFLYPIITHKSQVYLNQLVYLFQ